MIYVIFEAIESDGGGGVQPDGTYTNSGGGIVFPWDEN